MPVKWLKVHLSATSIDSEACAPGCYCRRRAHQRKRFPKKVRVCVFCRFGHVIEPAKPMFVPIFE